MTRTVSVEQFEHLSLEGEGFEPTMEPPGIFRDELAKAAGFSPTIRLDGQLRKNAPGPVMVGGPPEPPKPAVVNGRATWSHFSKDSAMSSPCDFTISATWDRGAEIVEVWAEAGRMVGEMITPPRPKPSTKRRSSKPAEGVIRKVMDAVNPMNPERWNITLDCGHTQWVTQKTKPPRGKKVACSECKS